MAFLSDKSPLCFAANEDCRIVIIGSKPLGKRHIFWNFVSSQKERIVQAKRD